MIKKKIKIKNNNNLLKLLFKSKLLYGNLIKNTNKELIPYIYGIRHNYTVIDFKYLIISLKNIFNLIKTFSKNSNNKILIISNNKDVKFLSNSIFLKQIIFFNKTWINGLITNKKLNKNLKKFIENKKINLILVLNLNENFIINELKSLKIPIINLINTNKTIDYITYPIICNNENIKFIYLLTYFLKKNYE